MDSRPGTVVAESTEDRKTGDDYLLPLHFLCITGERSALILYSHKSSNSSKNTLLQVNIHSKYCLSQRTGVLLTNYAEGFNHILYQVLSSTGVISLQFILLDYQYIMTHGFMSKQHFNVVFIVG